ncbi:hypothetical protein QQS21_007257 [Conoideocrella luteorostrata]|uniref:Uncharacterized protein n=1 Tax=Conoideocrella luteorostrata TaxID=1105319 RepID=A0AAJ0FXI5_9HYPO|nr:hypothetical protein QQS21_007257 [Conoideocrella luteorostrata]
MPISTGLTAEQSSLLFPLIRKNAWLDFENNFEQILDFWSNLVLDASLLGETASISDLEKVLLMLDNLITDETSPYWQRRLAYNQLATVVASTEQTSREHWHIEVQGRPSPRLTTIVIDAYVRALEGRISRNDVRLRMRWAKRQSSLFGGDLFLLFAYSEQAEAKT